MPVLIRTSEVRKVIADRFGESTERASSIAETVSELVRSWYPAHMTLTQLSERIQDTLFDGLRKTLGEGMLIRTGNGLRRVSTADLARASDDILGLMFRSMSETPEHYALVRDWGWQTGSLAALGCLAERFADYQPPEEQNMIRAIWKERAANEEARYSI